MGSDGWVYMIEHPHGSFAVFVSHITNGRPHPFEVWVNGAEQPRGLGAVAKTLSMDMRAEDRGWLNMKLAVLEKAAGDDAFNMPFPPSGDKVRMPSLVSGFARIVRYRCEQLGALDMKEGEAHAGAGCDVLEQGTQGQPGRHHELDGGCAQPRRRATISCWA